MKILHVVGGDPENGAFKGAYILHSALIKLKLDSKILNNSKPDNFKKKLKTKQFHFINEGIIKNILVLLFVFIERLLKSIFLHAPRETFTIGLMGFDITKLKAYKNADLIHIHWLGQGFINLGSLKKINKPILWTMRDMWPFTGGSHYNMDFVKYEKSKISEFIKIYKRKVFKENFQFIAVSDWLKKKAKSSYVLKNKKILKIDNNIDIKCFKKIKNEKAKKILKIKTKKQIIIYGAQNPQSKRKGWNLFLNSLKFLDKEKFYVLIFGNFWSHSDLDNIGIEYKSFGYIDDNKKLSIIYSCGDIFVASSVQDAWPKTFAEAMLCGTPTICFDNTSISEIVDHKINGYIVKKFDAKYLAKGITWLAKETKYNAKIRQNCQNKILKYDSNLIAKKYYHLYQKLLYKNYKNKY
jgi:glycosyltransferase involved in cell wall biosynthesis